MTTTEDIIAALQQRQHELVDEVGRIARALAELTTTTDEPPPLVVAPNPSTPVAPIELPQKPAPRKHDLVEVARIAREAHAANKPMGSAIAHTLNVSMDNARWLMRRARETGQDMPPAKGGPSRSAPLGYQGPANTLASSIVKLDKVLACADCDTEFEVDQAAQLLRHTREVHGRAATIAERTPVAA